MLSKETGWTRTRWIVGAVVAIALISGFGMQPAEASLSIFQTFIGEYGVSTDGFGSLSDAGTIHAYVPLGATVTAAYLYGATNFDTTPGATLNGINAAFGPAVVNGTACCTLASSRADVTSIVKPLIDGGPGGTYNFRIQETGVNATSGQDGEALVVVYNLPGLGKSTVGILDGWASVIGDSATMAFASPLDPNQPGFQAELRLGIGFSCGDPQCGGTQSSTVKVNGTTITTNAGNYDDADTPPNTGLNAADGLLITMGGNNDPFSPFLPSYADDHERYNLIPYINQGDLSLTFETSNTSQDDNIFLAVVIASGEAQIITTPEPTSVLLLASGLVGLVGFAWRRPRK